jgi:hypothetical protein
MFGVPCAGCARQVRIDTGECWGCGRRITDEERAAEHARRVQRGRWWIGFAAIAVAVWGLIEFAGQKMDAEKMIAGLDARAADGTAPQRQLALLHDRLAHRRVRTLGLNFGIAAMFGAFWLMARRAPVASLAAAISLLLGVWIASAAIDRSTLLDGYVIKLFALGAFLAGLRAALAARKASQGG